MNAVIAGAPIAETGGTLTERWSLVLALLALGVLFALTKAVHVLPANERLVIIRGRRRPVSRGPGVVLALPILATLTRIRVGQERVTVVLPLAATADRVRVRLEAIVEYDVRDAVLAAGSGQLPEHAVLDAARCALLELVTASSLHALADLRHRPLPAVACRITATVEQAGITVRAVEIESVDIPEITDVLGWADRGGYWVRAGAISRAG